MKEEKERCMCLRENIEFSKLEIGKQRIKQASEICVQGRTSDSTIMVLFSVYPCQHFLLLVFLWLLLFLCFVIHTQQCWCLTLGSALRDPSLWVLGTIYSIKDQIWLGHIQGKLATCHTITLVTTYIFGHFYCWAEKIFSFLV